MRIAREIQGIINSEENLDALGCEVGQLHCQIIIARKTRECWRKEERKGKIRKRMRRRRRRRRSGYSLGFQRYLIRCMSFFFYPSYLPLSLIHFHRSSPLVEHNERLADDSVANSSLFQRVLMRKLCRFSPIELSPSLSRPIDTTTVRKILTKQVNVHTKASTTQM